MTDYNIQEEIKKIRQDISDIRTITIQNYAIIRLLEEIKQELRSLEGIKHELAKKR